METDSATKTISLEDLRAKINEALTYLDVKLATEVQGQLEDLLASGNLTESLRQEFSLVLVKIKFLRFLSLEENELLDLISNYLLLVFDIPYFDLKDKIGKRIVLLGEIEAQIDFMGKLAAAFEHCKQTFGSKLILIGEKQYQPTVENWIKAYLDMPTKNSLRQNIDELSFIERGQAAKSLGKSERKNFLDILGIYDSLKNRISLYKSLPESDDEEEVFKNFDLYNFLPGLTAGREEEITPEQAGGTVYMEANTYRLSENLQPTSADSVNYPTAQVSQPLATRGQQILRPSAPPRPETPKPAFDIKSQEIARRIEEEKRLAQNQIDQKLEELKKKTGRKP